MDKRTLLAFILAFLVIMFYPYYLKKIYPPKPAPVIKEIRLDEETQTEIETKPIEIKAEQSLPSEEEITIKTPLVEITFSSYEATIKNIKLLKYLDKKNNPIELIHNLPVNYRPLVTNLPQTTSSYTIIQEGNSVKCTVSANHLQITKTYIINPDSYVITAILALENLGEKEITLPNYTVNVGTILPGEETQPGMYLNSTNLIDGKASRTNLGRPGFRVSNMGKIFWSGIKNKYFTLILKPQTFGIAVTLCDYAVDSKRGILSQITMPQITIPQKGKVEESFILYAGPKEYYILKSLGMGLDEIMDFGMFAPISKALLYILNLFYKFTRNYGIAIILLTILVRFVLYPLTLKSYKSMAEMHKLQPHIQELQKKYKDDPKRLNKEMMLLYKEHKVNPFSGCLPMLFQMPILIALFTTLRSAIELRGAPFILWIKDLSEPDALFRLPNGFAVNILPVFLLATFIIQQKMTSMPATTEQQRQQQKIMSFFMPVFMTFIFYSMPSGLVLYFWLSTLLGIFDQYRIQKKKG